MSEESKAVNNHGNVMDPHREYVEINSYVIFWGLFFVFKKKRGKKKLRNMGELVTRTE